MLSVVLQLESQHMETGLLPRKFHPVTWGSPQSTQYTTEQEWGLPSTILRAQYPTRIWALQHSPQAIPAVAHKP